MNPVKRMLPARENLRRIHGEGASELDVAGVDMMLHLINVVDIIRATIFEALKQRTGLSEGQFSLLMTLRDAGEPVNVGVLSERLGVAPATVSVMIRRMLQARVPLVVRKTSSRDGRASLIGLSPAGGSLLEQALPEHFARVAAFSKGLTGSEREKLIALLKKLADGTEPPSGG